MKTTRHTTKLLSLLIGSLFVSSESQANPPAANALPTGGGVTSGIGSISSAGNTLSVIQNSQNLFTQFDSFNIGSAAAVKFLQPNSSALAVGRILGNEASQIYGRLSANGQLFLLNPKGIVFGPSAQVNVGSLIASTLQLSDKDILSGQYQLSQGEGAGAIRNFGEIIAKEGGLVALVAPQVENQGLIRADRGQVALAAGNSVRLEIGQGGLVGVNVDAGLAQAQIDNSGSIFADGGKVWMTARQAGDMLSTAVNQTGVVRANTLADNNGEIRIDGGSQGKLVLGGEILAMGNNAGEKGGRISATANQVQVNGKLNASGTNGGGYIEIGGGFQGKNARLNNAERVALANTAVVQANATQNGDGGTAVVWSEKRSDVYGVMEAKGAGSGVGGLVETSSRGDLQLSAKVDVSAESGVHGSWLLDPTTIQIGNANATPTNGNNAVATVDATNISAALTAGSNVIVQGTDGIQIDADISKTGGARSSLTFEAPGAIRLGTVSQSRQISATDAPNSGVTSSLDVTFSPGTGASTAPVTLFGSVSTNGGNVVFNKDAVLSTARPISTSVAQPNNGTPASNVSGNITFNQKVTLSGSNPVTLDTQSVKDGGGNAISQGGNIVFAKALDSLGAGNLPLALTLNTTGSIVQGNANGNQSGSVTFKSDVGTTAQPLRSLTINGPSKVFLEGSQVNLKNDGGAVMTFSAPGQIRPALILDNPSTTINVKGFGTSGTSNYLQSTFDIVKGTGAAVNAADASLTINSDRSIQVLDRDILGSLAGTSEPTNKLLTVMLNSNKLGANSGGIALEGQRGVNVKTFGGTITLGGGTDGTGRAFGVTGEQNTDGVLLQNSVLDSSGGTNGGANITLRGSSPQSAATGGTAVRLFGTSKLDAGDKDILIDGVVNSTSSGAAKDAVLIGSGGTAAVNILTAGAGKITIQGDASGVGLVAQAGASYNGVELSRGANIRTVQGDILIRGFGGGGNNVNVGENMGVRLKDSDTQINSQTGNITLIGQTGGKTTSYGITSTGDDMAIGQRRDQTQLRNPVNAEPFTGNVNLVADSMKFVNNSSSRLRVTTKRQNAGALGTGQINIRSLHDVDIQIGGTEPTPPTSTNVANPDKPLFLAGEIFSGTNAVMIPGAGEINIGQFGDPNAPGLPIAETTKTITVSGATTVRDPLNIVAKGTGASVALNGNLTVQGTVAGDIARTLSIESDTTVTQATSASVTAANLRIDAGGNVLLVGPNQIGTVAGQTNGSISVANAQALTVGTVSRVFQTNTSASSGLNTQKNNIAATDRFLSVATNGANADLTITQALNNPGGLVNLSALGETLSTTERGNSIVQTGAGIFKGADLIVRAQDNSDLTLTGNEFNRLAADLSTGQGDLSLVRSAATAGNIEINTLTLPALATGAAAATVVTGVKSNTTNGQVYLQNLNGGLTQAATSPVVVAGLAAEVTTAVDLSTSATNQIGALAALTTNGSVNVTNQTAMRVDTVTTQNNVAIPATLKSLTGVRAQGTNQSVTLKVTGTAAAAGLTVASVDNTPQDTTQNNAISATGNVTLSTSAGALDIKGAILGSGTTSDIALTTAGGNIAIANAVNAERNLNVAVTAGSGGISTTAAAPLAAKTGGISLNTLSGAIDTQGTLVSTGAASDIVLLTTGGNIAVSNTVTSERNVNANVSSGAGAISTTSSGNIVAKTGGVNIATATGTVDTKGTVLASGSTADVAITTGGGNISVSNSVTAQRNVSANVSSGTGAISTDTNATITANTGGITFGTNNGAIAVGAKVDAKNGDIVAQAQTAGNVTIAAALIAENASRTADIVLATGSGTITLGVANPANNAQGDLIASVLGDVRLLGSSIIQNTSSEIVANAVSARATGTQAGDVSLRGENSFGILAASSNSGQIQVKNVNLAGTTIGTVEGDTRVATLSGVSSQGQFTLQSSGGISQTSSGVVNANGGLYVEANSGNVNLNNSANTIKTVAVKADSQPGQQVSVNSNSAVELSTLNRSNLDGTSSSQSGISTNSESGQVSIASGAGVTQKPGAKIKTNALAIQSTQDTVLSDASNEINSVSLISSANVTLVNSKSLSIDSLRNGANGQVQGGLITGLGQQANLKVEGSLNQTSAVVASSAAILASNEVNLNSTGNDIGLLAVKAAKLNIYDNNGLQIASLKTSLPGAGGSLSGLDAQDIHLQSVGDVIQQDNANLKVNTLAINTQSVLAGSGNVRLTNTQNLINNLAAQISGAGDIFTSNNLNLVTSNGIRGVSASSGLQIRSTGDITIMPGNTVSTLTRDLILSAAGAFTNLGGANSVLAPGGRWLIYDSNPKVTDRLGGLRPAFRKFETSYAKYSPSQVIEAGNGYLTDAVVSNPNVAIRQNGGTGSGSAAGGAQNSAAGMDAVQNQAAVPTVFASIGGAGLPDFPTTKTAFAEGGGANARFDAPVLVQVNNRVPFSIALNMVVGPEQVQGVTMRDGSPLPNWISFDAKQGVIVGRVPSTQNEPFTLAVNRVTPEGVEEPVYVYVNPTPLEEQSE